jgi:cytidylate kinase
VSDPRRDVSEGPTHPVIAIDGAAGTGKTTSAALVAERLGFCYVDSGAVYRAIALALRASGVESPDSPLLGQALAGLPLRIEPTPERFLVRLGDLELGEELRTPEVTRFSSRIAVRPDVRSRVRELLRQAGRIGPLVVEGRDIGTVVFPEAVLKVFLTADLPVRARRRRLDLLRQGIQQGEEEVARELAERDRRDSTRAEAPLRRPDGALEIDTGATDIAGQVRMILEGYVRATSGTAPRPGPAEARRSEDPSGRGWVPPPASGPCDQGSSG